MDLTNDFLSDFTKSIVKRYSSAEHFDTKPENIFLVQDELDKPVGKFSIKEGGSARSVDAESARNLTSLNVVHVFEPLKTSIYFAF